MQRTIIATTIALAAILSADSASADYYGLDGNFQSQGSADANLSANGFCYFNLVSTVPACSTSSPWNGVPGAQGGGAGMIVSGNGAWGGVGAPNGEGYYGFVQLSGVLTDTFTSTATGNFTLSWLDTNRPGGCAGGSCGPETYDVSISHGQTVVDLGQFTPATFGVWEAERSNTLFQLLAGTTYTISFAGLDVYPPDSTAFIDDLVLNVPEPMSMALLGSGLLALGLVRRRARRNQA